MKDYYAILEINRNCTEPDIRKAYRRLAKQWHPDVNKSPNAHEKFIEISEAYEFLINKSQQNKEPQRSRPASDYTKEEYERFHQAVHDRAQQRAKMRYEEFKKQHEAFQKSGINDIALFFTIVGRIAFILLFFLLLLFPIYAALQNEWPLVFMILVTGPFAYIIAWYVYDKRQNYFMPGKFYFTPLRIKRIFTETHMANQNCYYRPYEQADSKSYKIDLLKLKDIKVKSDGFRQHHSYYINDNTTILVPRSQKALIVHAANTAIKIMAIICSLFFSDISSIIWRLIIGMILGGFMSSILLWITHTKSNVSYLFTYGMIIRVALWMFFIAHISHLSVNPFNINTSGYIYFVIVSIIIFDCFLMQLINMAFGKYASKTIIRQHPNVELNFNHGYRVYNDVAVISVVYPIAKWILG